MAQKKKTVSDKTIPGLQNKKEPLSPKSHLTIKEILAAKCLDPLEVIAILKISAGTLNNWFKKGLLPISQIEKRRYIDCDDVIKMLDNGKNKPPKKQAQKLYKVTQLIVLK